MPDSTPIAASEPASVPTPTLWERYVRPASPERPNPVWHVSPVVDLLAYHFSWLWVLVPMLAAGDDPLRDYLVIFALVIGVNLAHRQLNLPYAYLDGEVFRRHRRKLTWFPLACVVAFVVTSMLLRPQGPNLYALQAFQATIVVSALWNFWHVYMQKYGILRLYVAKDPAPVDRKPPGWVDRWFLFAWFPLYLAYLVPANEAQILLYTGPIHAYVVGLLSFAKTYEAWLVAPAALAAAGGVLTWLAYERRANGWRNPARLSAALGILLLSTSLFWVDPLKAYIAFGFSHSLEYIVFVVAFQRRRYHRPRPTPSLNERLVARPILWYGLVIGVVAVVGTLDSLWGRVIFPGTSLPIVAGLPLGFWIFSYSIYESLVHFHLDGFLWKMGTERARSELGIEVAASPGA